MSEEDKKDWLIVHVLHVRLELCVKLDLASLLRCVCVCVLFFVSPSSMCGCEMLRVSAILAHHGGRRAGRVLVTDLRTPARACKCRVCSWKAPFGASALINTKPVTMVFTSHACRAFSGSVHVRVCFLASPVHQSQWVSKRTSCPVTSEPASRQASNQESPWPSPP